MSIKLGIIGTGNMGRNHVRVAKELTNCFELVSVFDPDVNRISALSLDDIAASSEEELLSKVDAVIVAAPSSLHKALALKIAKAGKHLLVEKPLSLSYSDSEEVVAAFKQSAKVLMVGHVERFNNVVGELEKVLEHEEIVAIQMERCSSMDLRISDTDVVYDLMIHDMDILLNSIMPSREIRNLQAFGTKAYSEKFVDYVESLLQFDNGAIASVVCSRTTEDKIRMTRIHCKNAYIEADLLNKTLTISRKTKLNLDVGYSPVYRQENIKEKVFVPGKEPLKAEQEHFYDCIVNGCKPKTDGVSAARSIKVLDSIKNQIYA